MTDKTSKSSSNRGIGAALKDLLDRAREGAGDLLGILNPSPRPALQPVPVRSPHRRSRLPGAQR